MKRTNWIHGALAALLISASPMSAMAAATVVITSPRMAHEETVIALYTDLAAQGYEYIKVGRSLLGRAVIDAYNGVEKREIVMNTATSEILRDLRNAYEGYPEAMENSAREATEDAAATARHAVDHVIEHVGSGVSFGFGE